MSQKEKHGEPEMNLNLSKLGIVIAVLAGIAGLAGAWFVLPYRMDAAEKAISEHTSQLAAQREILIRIDENVKDLRRTRDPSFPAR